MLPRTRYVVVFLTDGTPFPRCSANDNLPQYAGPTNPELAWEDSVGAGDFCNTIDPTDPDAITGFVKGTDRNQNYQLFSYVDQLMELRSSHNIGDIRLHTVLLFNKAAVTACGMICEDIYGQYPGVAPANYTDAAHTIAQWTLTRMAERGNGVFQEFNNGDIQTMGLGALDYSSLASKNVMKTLMLKALSSAPGATDRVVDADGDGLDDTLDNSFKSKSNQFFIDSDGDCFDDAFEVMHKDDGFRPDQKDTRGCDPASPITLGCTCRDTDGDGLSQYAELYLKTSAGLPDSDGDGIPDGLEARYGLDPLIPQKPGTDTDGDGVPDVVEFKLDSNPTRRDVEFQEKDGYRYEATPTEMPDGRMCYHFRVSNARLVTPPNQSGQRQGYNLFKLYFAEAPESAVAADYGVWKTACAWAEYAPPSVRVPAQPELQLVPTDFVTPSQMNDSAAYRSRCKGTPP